MIRHTFEQLVEEFITRTKAMVGHEVMEAGLPPKGPSPYRKEGPPFESEFDLDDDTVRAYARGIGEDNPLYSDFDYARNSRYGTPIAPGCALIMARGVTAHGAHEDRPEGYPLANFHSGVAWEFYDVLRVGTRLTTSQVLKEVFVKKGNQGNLVFCISENRYWDAHGDQPGKAYGTLIMVPQPTMGTSRSMPVEKLGEHLMYSRGATQYKSDQIQDIVAKVEGKKRRGSEAFYWEDVEIGEKLPTFVVPPWTNQDYDVSRWIGHSFWVGGFEYTYKDAKAAPRNAFPHPVTRWPYGPNLEHEDPMLAAYRGQSLPFDWGGQRAQIPSQLFSNWAGDDGFIRRWTSALRRPVYYSDTCMYNGEVTRKFTEVQRGEAREGGVPGTHTYHAVGIKYEGTNQVGQTFVQGTATIYLPSRAAGPVQLPIPHPVNPPFVPYETFYRDWYGPGTTA